MMKNRNQNSKMKSKVCRLAYALLQKKSSDFNQSEAMSRSWKEVKNNPQLQIASFTKKDGTTQNRVVDVNWLNFYTPTGTGRPLKEGQVLMVDWSKKVMLEDRYLISAYNVEFS